MLEVPFDKQSFSKEVKTMISGVNATLYYENVESSVMQTAETLTEILGSELYNAICTGTASTNPACQQKALYFLQRSLIHLAMHEHVIFLIAKVGNDGITTKKTDKETTIYKYQQDQLENKLITSGWFWMDRLIKLLDENKDDFPLWTYIPDTPMQAGDFRRWVGVPDVYFTIVAGWIIREVWTECVLSRCKEPEKTDTIAKAVCYEVVGRCCQRLSRYYLPSNIRQEVSNEQEKSKTLTETLVRDRIANIYLKKAEIYWQELDMALSSQKTSGDTAGTVSGRIYKSSSLEINENDSFYYS